MVKTKNYFVSFIDILGFKNLINSQSSLEDIQKVYTSLERTLFYLPDAYINHRGNRFFRFYIHAGFPEYSEDIIENLYNFSDSIIFFIECSEDLEENRDKFKAMCFVTNEFIKSPIITNPIVYQFASRGAIAHGPAIMDNNTRIHICQPLIDSYKLAENQNWMGGAIHHSVPDDYISPLVGHDKQLYEYDIPLKKENNENIKYALNWVQRHPNEKISKQGGIIKPIYKDIAENHVLKYDWDNQMEKRDNTLKFIEIICNQF
jgi:hypothetical protein